MAHFRPYAYEGLLIGTVSRMNATANRWHKLFWPVAYTPLARDAIMGELTSAAVCAASLMISKRNHVS